MTYNCEVLYTFTSVSQKKKTLPTMSETPPPCTATETNTSKREQHSASASWDISIQQCQRSPVERQQHESTTTKVRANQHVTSNTRSASTSSSQSHDNPQQFCLRWNNYQTNLTSVFDKLLQSESFVDVTLTCDGQSIKAHKIVLSACSPYFQGLFLDNPCQHPIIIMSDIKWPLLKAVVEFMYKGEINISQDEIGPLLRVAELLKIRGLADVTNDQELNAEVIPERLTVLPPQISATVKKPRKTPKDWHPMDEGQMNGEGVNGFSAMAGESSSRTGIQSTSHFKADALRHRKRQWSSTENNNIVDSPVKVTAADHLDAESPIPLNIIKNTTSALGVGIPQLSGPRSATSPMFANQSALEAMGLSSLLMNHSDDLEIKPEIAEMIREEERVSILLL